MTVSWALQKITCFCFHLKNPNAACHQSKNFPAKTTITTKDMMLVASLYTIIILLTITSSSSNNECYDAWECQSQELTGFVLCYGYQSCQSSSITSNYYVPCSGYKSCMNSKIESKSSITCDGDYACSNAQLSSPGLNKFIELHTVSKQ